MTRVIDCGPRRSTMTFRLTFASTCVSSREIRATTKSSTREGQTMIVEHNCQSARILRNIREETPGEPPQVVCLGLPPHEREELFVNNHSQAHQGIERLIRSEDDGFGREMLKVT